MTSESQKCLGEDPGPSPRSLSLGELYNALPAPLQIGALITPLTTVAVAIWQAYDPKGPGAAVWVACVFGNLVALIWSIRVRSLATSGQSILGQIIRIKGSDNVTMPYLANIIYEIEVKGQSYRGEFAAPDKRKIEGFHGGHGIYIVYDPNNPKRSMAWKIP